MDTDYRWYPRLGDVPEAVEKSIVSRVILNAPDCRATAFALDAGQALTEHSARAAAWVFFLAGEAEFRVGGEAACGGPGQRGLPGTGRATFAGGEDAGALPAVAVARQPRVSRGHAVGDDHA